MKVKVSYTVDVSDRYRRAINAHYGKPGLATRAEVQRWLWSVGQSCDDDIMHDLTQEEEAATAQK